MARIPEVDLSHDGDETYTVPGKCWNCGWKGTIKQTKGYPVRKPGISTAQRARCHYCGCGQVYHVEES